MEVIRTATAMQRWGEDARRLGLRVGVVPTMGALHAGHLSLVRGIRPHVDRVVATIFVNPTQFAPQEDLSRYPRTLEDDLRSLAELNVEAVWVPTEAEVYPADFSTYVQPPQVARRWEGEFRPTHFCGVATVVLKLLNVTRATVAIFGQKDFQQVAVIRQMVRDLNHPCEILVAPIARDSDGLALSSRNRYLSSDERARAVAIPRSLQRARERLEAGERSAARLQEQIEQDLRAGGIEHIDYVAVVDPVSLEPLVQEFNEAVVLVAVRIGSTRLIDNECWSRRT